jgi:hypothetical protein
MAIFDYSIEADLSPTGIEVGLFPTGKRRMRRQPTGYGRFARAADAIRFAIEELPPELLPAAQLKVAEERFDGDGDCTRASSTRSPDVVRTGGGRDKSSDLSGLGRPQ